jgi:ribonuclease E
VINQTEALVAIDVNSAQATKGADIEATAFNTNLEAADEAARQLRLRDLGGLIVIDFIDMENQKNQREVEDRLRDALHYDRARVQTGKISRFGLLELSRQRLQPSLGETSYITCPRCSGTGHVRSTESFALHLLRMLQEESMKENTGAVHVQVPIEVATFLLNEKRHDILSIEARHRVEVVLIPNMHFETPRYTLTRLRHDQLNQSEIQAPSYRMVEKPAEEEEMGKTGTVAKPERAQPVVQGITPAQPAPNHVAAETTLASPIAKPGLFGRIFGWLRGLNEPVEEAKPAEESKKSDARRGEREPRRGRGEREPREGRGERRPRGERPESGERPPRGERQDKREGREPREIREPREPRETREPRGERGERQDRPRRERAPAAEEARLPVQATAPAESEAVAEPAAGEDRDSRRRGRRGGRGRRGETAATTDQTVLELVAESGDQAVEAFLSTPTPVPIANQEPLVIKLETEREAKPAPQAPLLGKVEPAPATAPLPAPMPAPDLGSSGLELVETHSTSAVKAGEDVATAPAQRRRSRSRGAAATPAEPLVMVETLNEKAATPEATASSQGDWGPPSNPRRRARPQHTEQPAEPLVMVETRQGGAGDNKAA